MTPAPSDRMSTWLVAITAVAMGFLACLALAAATSADDLAESWTRGLEQRVTVALTQPTYAPDEERAAELTRATDVIRATPGVLSATPLTLEETRDLLGRALGGDADLFDVSVAPRLIDVRLTAAAEAPVARISRRLEAAGLPATVEAHGGWAARMEPAAARLRALASAALGAVAIASAVLIALATAFALSANARTVRVLSLVGAQDGAIARLFERRFQVLAFGGSAMGVALGAAALAAFADPLSGPFGDGASALQPSPADWARFALLPLGFAALATVASRGAVAIALRRPAT